MNVIPLHTINSGRATLHCQRVELDENESAKAGLVIATPPVLLIAYALRAHRSGRLDAVTADALIRRLHASGDATARIVAGFLLAHHRRLLDASSPTAGQPAVIPSPQSLPSSTDRRSS